MCDLRARANQEDRLFTNESRVVLSRAVILEPLCFFEIVATWIHRVGGLGCLNNGVTDEAFESRLVCACFVLDGGAEFGGADRYEGIWHGGEEGVGVLSGVALKVGDSAGIAEWEL